MALLELVSKPPTNTPATATLWDPAPFEKYTNASREIRTAGPRVAGNVFEWYIAREGDIVGECMLEAEAALRDPGWVKKLVDFHDAIESVTYTIGGQIVEKYSGQALKALSVFDVRARPSVGPDRVVVPLRLCTSQDTHAYMPLISLALHEVKVSVVIAPHWLDRIATDSVSLHVLFVHLDGEERRNLALNPQALRVTRKWSFEQSVDADGVSTYKVPLRFENTTDLHAVRDMFVSIRRKTGFSQALSRDDVQLRLMVMVDDAQTASAEPVFIERQQWLGELMLRQAIPKMCYGVCENPHDVYFFPFDHTPLSDVPTGSLNLVALNGFFEVRLAKGQYDVCVVARASSVLRTASGMVSVQ